LVIDGHLKAAAVGGKQGDCFDFRLERLQQFGRQTDGPASVVSNCTVFKSYLHQHQKILLAHQKIRQTQPNLLFPISILYVRKSPAGNTTG
jgi:hypothetical protein